MRALVYILDTVGTLYNAALLLRLIMQLARADFRNPIGRAIVQLTDPLVRPLRRVLPPAGRVDTASVVAVLLFALVKTWLLRALLGFAAFAATKSLAEPWWNSRRDAPSAFVRIVPSACPLRTATPTPRSARLTA